MFTQCYKCETVFRLSAEALRAAGGQVRCGRCGEVFNALARLSEDATGFTRGESSLELETRADEILQTAEPVEPAVAPSAETLSAKAPPADDRDVAQLKVLGPPKELDDASLEFTLPPGELDRIFIETTPSVLQVLAAQSRRSERSTGIEPVADLSMPVAAPTEEPAPVIAPSLPDPPASAEAAPAAEPAMAPAIRMTGLEVSDDVRQEMMSSFTHAELPEIHVQRRPLPSAVWAAVAVALGLTIAAQLFFTKSEWLSASAAAKLAPYQLRQWGVTGDPGAKGILRVRATILNAAAQLKPYPLLRVTLANRFGTRVAQREFEPSEYIGKSATQMLAPGERVDATLDIVDPGKEAEGFEIDVCVRGADQKPQCAAEVTAATAAAQRKP